MLNHILKISRIRFWSYIAGPFIIGTLLAISNLQDLLSIKFFIGLLFFLIPANIYLYGINDYFDYDTDKLNPKKKTKEQLVEGKLRKNLLIWLYACVILFILYALTLNTNAIILLAIFFLLSTFYSAPPLRFKSKPFIDSISNILYFIPGLVAYVSITNNIPNLLSLIGFACWTTAMHLYSAIPDIKYDKKAKLKTTAVMLGENKSLWLCFVLWSIFFVALIITVFQSNISQMLKYIFLITAIYPLFILSIILFKINLTKAYWYYPYINGIIGFIITISIMLLKF